MGSGKNITKIHCMIFLIKNIYLLMIKMLRFKQISVLLKFKSTLPLSVASVLERMLL